jgi:hypothetical protein
VFSLRYLGWWRLVASTVTPVLDPALSAILSKQTVLIGIKKLAANFAEVVLNP